MFSGWNSTIVLLSAHMPLSTISLASWLPSILTIFTAGALNLNASSSNPLSVRITEQLHESSYINWMRLPICILVHFLKKVQKISTFFKSIVIQNQNWNWNWEILEMLHLWCGELFVSMVHWKSNLFHVEWIVLTTSERWKWVWFHFWKNQTKVSFFNRITLIFIILLHEKLAWFQKYFCFGMAYMFPWYEPNGKRMMYFIKHGLLRKPPILWRSCLENCHIGTIGESKRNRNKKISREYEQ